jgi:hypothetical protein
MKRAWTRRRRRRDIEESGKRDTQYKWPMIRMQWDDATRAEIATEDIANLNESNGGPGDS